MATTLVKTYSSDYEHAPRFEGRCLVEDEILVGEFVKDGALIGIIRYPNKAFGYVDDALLNWVNGIFKEEDVKRYARLTGE